MGSLYSVDGTTGDITTAGNLTASATSNQIILGLTNTTTLSAIAPSASRIYTLLDAGINTNVLLSGWGQIVNADISTLANIAVGKLALADSKIIVGNGSGVGAAVALSGDATLADTGALTLATVNSNIGSFTIASVTVNAKGLVTAASNASTTGSGSVVLANSPTLTTPNLGTPSALVLTNATGLPNSATTATASASANTIMLRDANVNTKVNTIIENFTTTVTAAGTTVLTAATSPIQQFTGTSTQTVTLPDATTLAIGYQITVLNRSTGIITVNNNGGSLQATVPATAQTTFTCTNISSANGTWDVSTSSAASAATFREDYVVGTALNNYTGSTTVFNLVNSYAPGNHTLLVTLDGDVQTVGATVDYVETNTTTVTFNNALIVGQKVSFIFSQPGSGGIINSGTATHLSYYATSTNAISDANGSTISGTYTFSGGAGALTLSGSTIAMGSNKITGLANGTASTDAMAFGQNHVFQVLSFTSTSPTSTTTTAWTNTNLTLAITPSSSSSKIKITISGTLESSTGSAATAASIFRGSTNLGDGTFGHSVNSVGAGTNVVLPCSIVYVDSPATTSAVTYTLKISSIGGSATATWGLSSLVQSIILEEIQ